MGKNVHVVKHGDGWAARKEGSSRVSVATSTQAEAISAARRLAQNERSELVVHGRDGKIREKDSHGHDPFPPKG